MYIIYIYIHVYIWMQWVERKTALPLHPEQTGWFHPRLTLSQEKAVTTIPPRKTAWKLKQNIDRLTQLTLRFISLQTDCDCGAPYNFSAVDLICVLSVSGEPSSICDLACTESVVSCSWILVVSASHHEFHSRNSWNTLKHPGNDARV